MVHFRKSKLKFLVLNFRNKFAIKNVDLLQFCFPIVKNFKQHIE